MVPRRKKKGNISTAFPSEILQNSHSYKYRFDQIIFEKLNRFIYTSQGNSDYRKKFKPHLPDGVIIPTPEKGKFKGLPLQKDLADKFGYTVEEPYNWQMGVDTVYNNYMFFFPNREKDGKFYINSVIVGPENIQEHESDIFKTSLYIWHECITIRPDIDSLNFKVPYKFLKPSDSDAYDVELQIKRPAYMLFYDSVGNFFYYRVKYTKAGYIDKYHYPAFFCYEDLEDDDFDDDLDAEIKVLDDDLDAENEV